MTVITTSSYPKLSEIMDAYFSINKTAPAFSVFIINYPILSKGEK